MYRRNNENIMNDRKFCEIDNDNEICMQQYVTTQLQFKNNNIQY